MDKLTTTEVATPLQATTSMTGVVAFAGLAGYMTLGLGAKPKTQVLRLSDTEALIAKDSESMKKQTQKLSYEISVIRSGIRDWP
jgi:hypothetical protein